LPEPASGVVLFTQFLKENGITPPAKAIDIGCGKGRNTAYLASLGFDVFAIDYIPLAVERTKQLAKANGLESKTHAQLAPIDERWPFADNYFDVAVDSFSSIDIETRKGRETCRDELFRTLKPGSYALVTVVSTSDEIEKEFLESSPGYENNSVIWPQTGKFQKVYDEPELREFYGMFELVQLKEIRKKAFKLNRQYTATNYWMVLRKPKA
jgi:SAM-dependent methyltransferase